MSGNQLVIWSDRRTATGKLCAQLSSMARCDLNVIDDLKARSEALHDGQVLLGHLNLSRYGLETADQNSSEGEASHNAIRLRQIRRSSLGASSLRPLCSLAAA